MKKFVAPTLARYVRRPVFNLAGAMRPFGLYPIQASPVLAGDTVMYSMLRGRFISQPMKHPITGGWLEFWQVFVPMRVIGRTATVNDIAPPTTGLVYTADAPRFFGKNTQLDHVRAAYLKVVTDFFTQTGVTVPDFDGVKQLPMMGTDWAENLMLRPASANPAVWPQQNVTEELTGLDVETERQLIESADYRAFTQQFGVKDPGRTTARVSSATCGPGLSRRSLSTLLLALLARRFSSIRTSQTKSRSGLRSMVSISCCVRSARSCSRGWRTVPSLAA